jgi:hypothetical protein
LNSLIIKYCKVLDNQNLCISSATLAHLTIKYCDFELYTPSLRTLVYKGYPTVQQLCGSKSNLSSIKHVNIKAIPSLQSVKTSFVLRNWLVEIANIESLTICSTTLQVLYSWFRFLLIHLCFFQFHFSSKNMTCVKLIVIHGNLSIDLDSLLSF